jgi:hypothetical protein
VVLPISPKQFDGLAFESKREGVLSLQTLLIVPANFKFMTGLQVCSLRKFRAVFKI